MVTFLVILQLALMVAAWLAWHEYRIAKRKLSRAWDEAAALESALRTTQQEREDAIAECDKLHDENESIRHRLEDASKKLAKSLEDIAAAQQTASNNSSMVAEWRHRYQSLRDRHQEVVRLLDEANQ